MPSGTSPQSAGEFGVVGEHAVECLGGRPAQVGGEDRKGLVGAEDRAHGFAAGALRRNEAGGGDGEFALGGLEVVADPDRADQHRADEVRPLVPRGGVQVAGPAAVSFPKGPMSHVPIAASRSSSATILAAATDTPPPPGPAGTSRRARQRAPVRRDFGSTGRRGGHGQGSDGVGMGFSNQWWAYGSSLKAGTSVKPKEW